MIKSFSDFCYVDLFRRYSRSKSKVVKNREKIWTRKFGCFFAATIFLGADIVKIVPNLSPLPRGTSTEKRSVRLLPLARKLLTLKRQILGQIFNFHDYNFFWGDPCPTSGVRYQGLINL